ncbi:MAG TPA: cation diffusion facilitator family transporter [Gemmatimonadaceae bacterium]|jgi:cobalt-zinc-cadmium efflux system protein
MAHSHSQATEHVHEHDPDQDHAGCAHEHGLHGPRPSVTRALQIALGLTLALMIAEVLGGLLSNSLALLADAGHMLTDAGALGLSLFVGWMCRQPSRPEKTYGYLRWEILAALLNGATLLLISFWIVWEAIRRFSHPEHVAGGLMLVFAAIGLVVNVIAVYILHGVNGASLNVRGAYLHVLGDLLASGGTIIAAVFVRTTGWIIADPIASLVSTVLIIGSAWSLVREAVDVLLEAAPPHIALEAVRTRLQSIPGVESVHDLHIWTVTSGVVAMSVHAIVRQPENHQDVLENAHDLLQEMGIQHVTVQLERREMYERELHLHP